MADKMLQPLSKDQLIRAFDAAHDQLLVAATAVMGWECVGREGGWGPREVLAHIAGWAAEATTRIPQVIAGSPPLTYTDADQHAAVDDAFNAAVIMILGDQSFEQVCRISQEAHQRFKQMLQAQNEDIFVPGSYVYERLKLVIDHHLQHAQELNELT
jgi:hypothetical protein